MIMLNADTAGEHGGIAFPGFVVAECTKFQGRFPKP